jgi:L-glutamine-phosphate cytidylyltransferase
MKVIIPAAGRGTRLEPLTKDKPKCLVKVNGKPLLGHMLEQLSNFNIDEVIIVTGYKSELIEDYLRTVRFRGVRTIYNEEHAYTNSIVSVAKTRELWSSDFCIIDSDLLMKTELMEQLIKSTTTSLVIDNSKPAGEIDMKVSLKGNYLEYMDKELPEAKTAGEFFGLSKWTADSGRIISGIIERMMNENRTDVWYEFAIREAAKTIDIPVTYCSSDTWVEVDNMNDYYKAQLFFQ